MSARGTMDEPAPNTGEKSGQEERRFDQQQYDLLKRCSEEGEDGIKEDLLWPNEFLTVEALAQALQRRVQFYNHEYPHSTLGYASPVNSRDNRPRKPLQPRRVGVGLTGLPG